MVISFFSNTNLPGQNQTRSASYPFSPSFVYYVAMNLILNDGLCFIGCSTSILIVHSTRLRHYDLEEVCWLVKSGPRFAIMAITIWSIPTDGTLDRRMLVGRFILDQA